MKKITTQKPKPRLIKAAEIAKAKAEAEAKANEVKPKSPQQVRDEWLKEHRALVAQREAQLSLLRRGW